MPKLTKAAIENLAKEIRQYLLDREMWIDTTIYFNGKAFSTGDGQGHHYYNDPLHLVVLENEDPHRYTEYAGDILTVSFEGPLYDALNYGDDNWAAEEELNKIIKDREAEANRLVAVEALNNIKSLISTIRSLGYNIRLPQIGGSYVRIHNPVVTENNIVLTGW